MIKALKIIFFLATIVLLGLFALYVYTVWEGAVDMQVPTTDNRRMTLRMASIDLERSASHVTRESVYKTTSIHYHRKNGRPKWGTHYLLSKLPSGASLLVTASLLNDGFYKHGGGIMGGGHYHTGLHDSVSTVIAVSSSDESVVNISIANVNKRTTQIHIETLSAGSAQITVSMSEADYEDKLIGNAVTDTLTLTIYDGPKK